MVGAPMLVMLKPPLVMLESLILGSTCPSAFAAPASAIVSAAASRAASAILRSVFIMLNLSMRYSRRRWSCVSSSISSFSFAAPSANDFFEASDSRLRILILRAMLRSISVMPSRSRLSLCSFWFTLASATVSANMSAPPVFCLSEPPPPLLPPMSAFIRMLRRTDWRSFAQRSFDCDLPPVLLPSPPSSALLSLRTLATLFSACSAPAMGGSAPGSSAAAASPPAGATDVGAADADTVAPSVSGAAAKGGLSANCAEFGPLPLALLGLLPRALLCRELRWLPPSAPAPPAAACCCDCDLSLAAPSDLRAL
mmetsp:Transcript_16635/g.51710  ORF Transcript_16635/g.51710 Transcript_16635/m.51710 type:complete len:311 (-) Transcript_16635:210-1142(-)